MNKGVSGKLRILVVEQEPIAREILADLLKMAGYDVLATHNGEQALLALMQERGRLDCLFTAVELPGLVDGWMLAEEFRSNDAARPVVFATGQERTDQAAAGDRLRRPAPAAAPGRRGDQRADRQERGRPRIAALGAGRRRRAAGRRDAVRPVGRRSCGRPDSRRTRQP